MEVIVTLPSSERHPQQKAFIECDVKRSIVRAGRRGGKTVGVGIKACRHFLQRKRVLYAAPTSEQVARFWTTVTRAFQEPISKNVLYKNEGMHILELPGTETRIRAKSAWNADTLRGDYADVLILDEWQLMNEDAWELVGAPMLLDNNGSAIFIYTPPSLKSRSASKANDPQHAAKLFAKAKKEEETALKEGRIPRWKTFHFSSRENPYISSDALEEITQDMTSVAYRMEILAEDISEAPGALWKRIYIDDMRVTRMPGDAEKLVVAIDPSATSEGDEAGIVAAGLFEGHGYVLDDWSVQGSPLAWATRAIELYNELQADRIVAEANNGGEMISTVIHQIDPDVPVKLVHASRGKQTRAEPISAKYEQGKVHHVGKFDKLEDEMCLWIPGDQSPNRMDAMVWALTDLMLGARPGNIRIVGDITEREKLVKQKCVDCGEEHECVEKNGDLVCRSCLNEREKWEGFDDDDREDW